MLVVVLVQRTALQKCHSNEILQSRRRL